MTSTDWHQQSDINRMKSTECQQQSDIHRCTVLPWPLLHPDSVRYDFIPFTCRQWVPTSMIRTGCTTMTAALSKTERSILHVCFGFHKTNRELTNGQKARICSYYWNSVKFAFSVPYISPCGWGETDTSRPKTIKQKAVFLEPQIWLCLGQNSSRRATIPPVLALLSAARGRHYHLPLEGGAAGRREKFTEHRGTNSPWSAPG